MVRAIVSQMKVLGQQWHGDQDNEALHEKAAAYAARLPQYGVEASFNPASGVWTVTKDALNPSNVGKNLYTVYHRGGIAGDQPTLKQNEVMAILKKGEPVLDKEREEGLYRIIDFAEELGKRLGKAVGSIDFSKVAAMANQMFLPTSPTETATLAGVSANGAQISFGDVNIYGADGDTVKQHIEVNRKFVNTILDTLNIRR